MILGLIILLAGLGSAGYGYYLNNHSEGILTDIENFVNTGSTNPGDIWFYAGLAVAAVGLLVFIVGIFKRK